MIKEKTWTDDDVHFYVEISGNYDELSVKQNDSECGEYIGDIHSTMYLLEKEMKYFEKKFGLDCNEDLWDIFEADIIRLYPED